MRKILLALAGLFLLLGTSARSSDAKFAREILFCDTEQQARQFMSLVSQSPPLSGSAALLQVNVDARKPDACVFMFVLYEEAETLAMVETHDREFRVAPVTILAIQVARDIMQRIQPVKFFGVIAKRITKT